MLPTMPILTAEVAGYGGTMNPFRMTALLLVASSLAPLGAETIAVAVRNRSELDEAAVLAELVEQGVMDSLFAAGHIVFDLEIDPEDPAYDRRSTDAASIGGAAYVAVIELQFRTGGTHGTRPESAAVAVLDARTTERLSRATVSAGDLQTDSEMTADTLAGVLGERASLVVLEATRGDEPAW